MATTSEELAGIGDHGYNNGNGRCRDNHSLAIMTERSVEEDALDTMLETSVIELDEALKMGSMANDTVSTAATTASLAGLEPIVVDGSGVQWNTTTGTVHSLQQESPTSSSLFKRSYFPTRNALLAKDDETTYQSLLLQTSPLSSSQQQQRDDEDDEQGAPNELPAAPVVLLLDNISTPSPVRVEIIKTPTTSSVVAVPRSGRWTLDEKVLFLYGLQKYGRGKWKQIQCYCPGRYVEMMRLDYIYQS
jgi:hypothetical protein